MLDKDIENTIVVGQNFWKKSLKSYSNLMFSGTSVDRLASSNASTSRIGEY